MPEAVQLLSHWGMIIFQLLVAVFCGGVIGYQRETLERPAGFRTHILVCVGSAVYMLVSVAVAGNQYDPGRIAAQVASGMGFLGAGTIIKQGSIVRGLTTAASLWAVAGLGLAAGYGGNALAIALLGTLIVLLALTSLKNIERLVGRGHSCALHITAINPREVIATIRTVLGERGIEMLDIRMQREDQGEIIIDARTPSDEELELAVTELLRNESIRGIRWQCR